MDVKTADLKNHLSKYLHRIQRTGETLVVYDRDEPIATLTPLDRSADKEWQRYREEALARAKKFKISISIPVQRPTHSPFPGDGPTLAPDGRSDLQSIDLVRGEKNY